MSMHAEAPGSERPIVILGPTAGGKSELAVALAERLGDTGAPGGEIIGADSMQVYQHLDAGTAKPSHELRQRVPHHLIDIVAPTARFTVADWLRLADESIEAIPRRGRRSIVVGGTNLYLKVLLEGMFEAPGHDPAFRASLEAVDTSTLHVRLHTLDPAAADRIHPNDRKRIVRALEVHHLTGSPISAQQRQWSDQATTPGGSVTSYRHDPILIGLDWPADALNRRINQRVKRMFHPVPADAGEAAPESLPEEVRRLEAAGLLGPPGTQVREALGYKQVLAALAGQCTMHEAFEQTKIQTRRLAKQQRTWLRRFRGVHWLPAAELDATALAARAREVVRRA